MKHIRLVWMLLFFLIVYGCTAPSEWYKIKGLSETDLTNEDAIIAAVEVFDGNYPRGDRKAAYLFLTKLKLNKSQAILLSDQIAKMENEDALFRVTELLVNEGYMKEAYPGLLKCINHRRGSSRAYAASNFGKIGCDARETIPMLKVVSSHDDFGIERIARKAIRAITLDCMDKKVDLNN